MNWSWFGLILSVHRVRTSSKLRPHSTSRVTAGNKAGGCQNDVQVPLAGACNTKQAGNPVKDLELLDDSKQCCYNAKQRVSSLRSTSSAETGIAVEVNIELHVVQASVLLA